MPVGRLFWIVGDGHEIDELADALFRHEARDQHRRVWEVQLLDDAVLTFGRDTKVPAALLIQDPREDARRVETRATVPIDGAVRRDQRGRLEVTDETVIGNQRRGGPAPGAGLCGRRFFRECHGPPLPLRTGAGRTCACVLACEADLPLVYGRDTECASVHSLNSPESSDW